MTTLTPTSDERSGLASAGPVTLPDESWLTRLAQEAANALGAGAPAPVSPRPPVPGGLGGAQLPAVPGETGAAGASGLDAAGVVGLAASAATAFAESLAATGGRPNVPAGFVPTFEPASPFELAPGALAPQAPSGGRGLSFAVSSVLGPQTHGLPGADGLPGLFSGLGARPPQPGLAGLPGAGPAAYYFLEPQAAAPSDRLGTRSGQRWVGAADGNAHPGFDVQAIRRDFPILAERVNGRPLIWLDNAATTQKPQAVIDRLAHFYQHENSNIHRAAHELAARATQAYEDARRTVARFLGASSEEEIVFVRGTTEAINLVAKSWGASNVGRDDEIVVSLLEHHANIVPWQQLAAATGARIRVIPVDADGQIRLDEYQKLLNDRTKIVAISQVSNALGTVTPVPEIIELAHRAGARVLVDGAQSVAHLQVDVRALDADFFVFSGHKIFGPTGIGVLYGKSEILEAMEPWQGGGNMIADVTFERTIYQKPPSRFEAGTGNIADAVGLAAALDYLERLGLDNVARYEHELLGYGTEALLGVPGLHLIGTAANKASVLSFVLDGYSPSEVGTELNREGIAVRAGHHCAQPIVRHFGHEATVRPSLALYNTVEEVDVLAAVLRRLAKGRRTGAAPSVAVHGLPERQLFGDWGGPLDPRKQSRGGIPSQVDLRNTDGFGADALDGIIAR